MRNLRNVRRSSAAVVVALCALVLSACLVLPGKFAATLDLRKDGHFSYTYQGAIAISASLVSPRKTMSPW